MTITPELEAMALAMWRAREEQFPRFTRHDPDQIDRASGAWALMLIMAAAGLKAIKEPSEAALEAGRDVVVCHSWGKGGEYIADPESIIATYVDHILGEPKP